MAWVQRAGVAMGVLLIGASAVVVPRDLGQARTLDFPQTTKDLPQTTENGSEALAALTIPHTVPDTAFDTRPGVDEGAAIETSPRLRLASPRAPQPAQQPPPEASHQPPAQVATPSPDRAPPAPSEHGGQPQNSPPPAADRHQDTQSVQSRSPAKRQQVSPRGEQPPPQQASPVVNQGAQQPADQRQSQPQTQVRTQGQQDTPLRQVQNEREDSVRRRAQSEQQELARRTGRELPAATPPAQSQYRERQNTQAVQGQGTQDRQGNQDRRANQGNQDRQANQGNQDRQANQGNQDRQANQGNQDRQDSQNRQDTPPGQGQSDQTGQVEGGQGSTSSAQFDGTPMMRVGAATARDGAGNRFANLSLPPPPDSYRQSELLVANPSSALVAELVRRRYRVEQPNAGGLARVLLPPDAPNAWDVLRELEASFPGPTFGLNAIYRPPDYHTYHLQSDAKAAGPPPTRQELLALIGWKDKGELAACAAGVEIGMIDTLVDGNHRFFAGSQIKSINLALKQDAPPAPHWHATGVLSVMAGLPNSTTPALIPGARFTAINVFFTNKEGQLETDTAHLTEALAYLDEKTDVQIVNMSLVGPQDELVHARIASMARKGKVFVGAAGNGGPHAPAGYPAAYAEVIAVTAVDGKGGNWDHANRGAYIDVAAPGVQIRTALPGDKEGVLSGTSFAAPFVTAAVAVAYRDSGLEGAVKQGGGPQDFKGLMLAQLLSKDQLKTRNPVYGHGVISARSTCASARSWVSSVQPEPSPPAPVLPAARVEPTVTGGWQASVQQAALAPKPH